MVSTCRYIIVITIIITFAYSTHSKKKIEHSLGHGHSGAVRKREPHDWRVIEGLAEEHPYIVALLSSMKDYLCTGSIINKRCVLTSGSCVTYKPRYVAVSAAVYSKRVNNNTIFKVASATIHADYIFDLRASDPNVTKMHSNIGLIFVDRPFLDLFINVADIGNYFASELLNKKMVAIGYGNLGTPNLVALQFQDYVQTPCMNPKWYYCICGMEYSASGKTYFSEFGIGAPALLDSLLVGVSAAPCGTLTITSLGMKYNVFTVVGPYLPWMEKINHGNLTKKLVFRSKSAIVQQNNLLKHFHIFLMISKIFF